MIREITIKNMIDKWDPIGLLVIHAPLDEYDSESKKIYNLVSGKKDLDSYELGMIIHKVFIEYFGDNIFLKTVDECIEIANTIIK